MSLPNMHDLQDMVHEPTFLDNDANEEENPLLQDSVNSNVEGHTNYALNDIKVNTINECNIPQSSTTVTNCSPPSPPPPCVVSNQCSAAFTDDASPTPQVDDIKSEEAHDDDVVLNEAVTDQETTVAVKCDNLPLPWKSAPSQTELSHAQDIAQPTASYRLKPMPNDRLKPDVSSSVEPQEDFSSPLPPPWKNNGNFSVIFMAFSYQDFREVDVVLSIDHKSYVYIIDHS